MTSQKAANHKARSIRIGSRRVPLPQSPVLRQCLGVLFVIFGMLGFLPVLGFWMIPVGLLILSVDIPVIRRLRRKVEIWWHRRKRQKKTTQRRSA